VNVVMGSRWKAEQAERRDSTEAYS